MTTPRPQKPFLGTYARLMKVMAGNELDLSQLRDAVTRPSVKEATAKASVVIDAAKAGQIRAATRTPDATITALGRSVTDLMGKMIKPPETTTRVTPAMLESLKSIYDQHQTTAMALKSDQEKIEMMRKRILEAVSRSPISSEEIRKLETETKKYFSEIAALEEKTKPFLRKVELQAMNVVPSVQIPEEQRRLIN